VTSGAHFLLYSKNPEVDRVFFCDILGLPFINAANGWLILARPPTEVRIRTQLHGDRQLLRAVCENLSAVMEFESRNVACLPMTEEHWGRRTSTRLPSSGEIRLYQPAYPTAIQPTLT